jgi:hypothetical protein
MLILILAAAGFLLSKPSTKFISREEKLRTEIEAQEHERTRLPQIFTMTSETRISAFENLYEHFREVS